MPKYKIEERGTDSDGSPIRGTPLRRVPDTFDPLYTTPDGRFSVQRVTHDSTYFSPSYVSWYWQDGEEEVHDQFSTKWEAVNALCHHLIEQGLAK